MSYAANDVAGQPGVLLQLSGFTCADSNDRKVITARPEVNRVSRTYRYCVKHATADSYLEVDVTCAINVH